MMNTKFDKAFDIATYAMVFVILTVLAMLGLAYSIAAGMILGAVVMVCMQIFATYFTIDEIKQILKKKES